MKFFANKTLLVLLVLNLVLLLFWSIVFYQVTNIRAEYKSISIPLAEENSKESYVIKVNRELRESETERLILDKQIVNKGDEASFLEQVEFLSAQAGAQLKVLAFEERGGVLRLNVISRGSFRDVYYFMSLLETFPFRVTIEKGLISKEINDNGITKWEGNFSVILRNYYSDKK